MKKIRKRNTLLVIICSINTYCLVTIYNDFTKEFDFEDISNRVRGNKNVSQSEEDALLNLCEIKGNLLDKFELYKNFSKYYSARRDPNKARYYCMKALSDDIRKEFVKRNNKKHTNDFYSYNLAIESYYSYCLLAGIKYGKDDILSIIVDDSKIFSYSKVAFEYTKNKNYLWKSYLEIIDTPNFEYADSLLLECTYWSLVNQKEYAKALVLGQKLLRFNDVLFLNESSLKTLEDQLPK